MIVFRVSGRVKEAMLGEACELFAALSAASRNVPGVISFDVAQDVTDPAVLISTEVYEDEDALARQGGLPELQVLMAALDGLFEERPTGTLFLVSSADPWPG